MTRKRYTQAINEALIEEMERNPKMIVIGEDVEIDMFGDLATLRERFGPDRVRNTPICEASLAGLAVGAAAAGYHVVLHLMFANFIYTAYDAIANQMARLRLMTGGQIKLPITVLTVYGAGGSQGAQHSDCPHPALMNLGGVDVVLPAAPADAKGLLKTALRSDTPTFFFEAAGLGGSSGEVPDDEYLIPFGEVNVVEEGTDVTLISIGSMMKPAKAAVKLLKSQGVSVHFVDVRTVAPLDEAGILKAVARTGRVVIVDEARERASAASEISALVAERGWHTLKAPVRRATVPNVAMPYAPAAEAAVMPSGQSISALVSSILAEKVVAA